MDVLLKAISAATETETTETVTEMTETETETEIETETKIVTEIVTKTVKETITTITTVQITMEIIMDQTITEAEAEIKAIADLTITLMTEEHILLDAIAAAEEKTITTTNISSWLEKVHSSCTFFPCLCKKRQQLPIRKPLSDLFPFILLVTAA